MKLPLYLFCDWPFQLRKKRNKLSEFWVEKKEVKSFKDLIILIIFCFHFREKFIVTKLLQRDFKPLLHMSLKISSHLSFLGMMWVRRNTWMYRYLGKVLGRYLFKKRMIIINLPIGWVPSAERSNNPGNQLLYRQSIRETAWLCVSPVYPCQLILRWSLCVNRLIGCSLCPP